MLGQGANIALMGLVRDCHCEYTALLLAGLCIVASLGDAVAQPQNSPPGTPDFDRAFQSATTHYEARQYVQAQNDLEPLLARLPDRFEVNELMGLLYAAQGQDEKANPYLKKAARLKPGDPAARTNLAVNLVHLGKDSLAEVEFKKTVELEPQNFDANHNLGEFYVRTGRIAAAIPYLQKAQTADPAAYDNGYDLALAYERTNHAPEARRQVRELLKQKDTAELHNLLAEIEEKAGDYVAAVNEYETAAHLDPSESNLFDWGSELLAHQTSNPAIEVFSQGLNRYPSSSRLAVGLGLALYLAGRYDDAVKALLRATDLEPSDAHAYYFLSQAYDRSPSQAEGVIQRFRRFAGLRPHDAHAAFYYAMSLWKGRRSETSGANLDEVESLLRKALALDPLLSEAHLQLGNFYSQRREYARAVPEYQQALSLSPNAPDAHFRLGQAYVHLGEKDLGEKEFRLHRQLYEQHLAEVDKQRSEIQQFVYSMKGEPARQ
jgi:tetratricopeptide (TPR) repeat protein